jgi:hypothetical protein
MGDRLLEGRAAQGLVARLAPPFDGEIIEPGLGEVMGDDFRLGDSAKTVVLRSFWGPCSISSALPRTRKAA